MAQTARARAARQGALDARDAEQRAHTWRRRSGRHRHHAHQARSRHPAKHDSLTNDPEHSISRTTPWFPWIHAMKESGMRIRVEAELRKQFIDACRSRDLTAAQVLRAFMRHYVSQRGSPWQSDLFDSVSAGTVELRREGVS